MSVLTSQTIRVAHDRLGTSRFSLPRTFWQVPSVRVTPLWSERYRDWITGFRGHHPIAATPRGDGRLPTLQRRGPELLACRVPRCLLGPATTRPCSVSYCTPSSRHVTMRHWHEDHYSITLSCTCSRKSIVPQSSWPIDHHYRTLSCPIVPYRTLS